MPHVVEPAAGLTRAVLAYLCDAYAEVWGGLAAECACFGSRERALIVLLSPRFG